MYVSTCLNMKSESSRIWSSREIADKIANEEFSLHGATSRSRVWCIFAKISDENGQEVTGYVCCRVCKKVFTYSKTSTSNLVKHKCYVLKYVLSADNSATLNESDLPKLEISNLSADCNVDDIDNNLTKLITKCLIKNCRSYELIQHEDFKAVLKEFVAFGSKYGTGIDVGKFLPSPKAVARNVYEVYGNCFNRIHTELGAIKNNGFGLATHIWRNNFLKKHYLALTVHFLNQGVVRSCFLGLKPMEGEQCTKQNISDKVEYILKDYDCEFSNKTLLVTSGCSDIMSSQTIVCISELLNTALQKSMEEVPEVAEITNSCLKLLNVLNREEINIFPEQRVCSSRWITLFEVLKLMTLHWSEIKSALEHQNEEKQIKYINIEYLKALVRVLEPFEEAFCSLENESKPTLHLVLVYLHELKKSCDSNTEEEYDFIDILRDILSCQLKKITEENVTIYHKLALFLYPPTRKLLQFSAKEKQHVETECIRLMKCFESDVKPIVKQEPNTNCSPASKRRKLFSDFLEYETSNDQNEFIQQEIQIYKMSRVVYSEDFDVFCYWEQQKDNFPLLSKLSRMIFSIPATSISAQRIFTSVGSLLCDKISGLDSSDTNIEQIAFIKFNAEQDELDF